MPAFLPVVGRFLAAAARAAARAGKAYGSRRRWYEAKAKDDAKWAKMRRGRHGG